MTIAAEVIATKINQWISAKANAADPEGWTDLDRFRRYVDVVRSTRAHARDSQTVIVTTAGTKDGRTWGEGVMRAAIDNAITWFPAVSGQISMHGLYTAKFAIARPRR